MNREEVKEILGENATEEQITNFLNRYHEKEKAKNEELTALKNKVSKFEGLENKYTALQSQMDEINKSKMTEQEKLEAKAQELANKEKVLNASINTAKAREILAGEEVNDKILARMVNGTLEETIELATLYKESLTTLKDNVAKQTKETLTNVDLKPSMSNVNQGEDVMTFDKFNKLSAEEQNKFVEEHPEEFENL